MKIYDVQYMKNVNKNDECRVSGGVSQRVSGGLSMRYRKNLKDQPLQKPEDLLCI